MTLLAWTRLLALDDDLAKAEPKALRFRIFSAPARHARKRVLKISTGWAWAYSRSPGTGSQHSTRPDGELRVLAPPSQ